MHTVFMVDDSVANLVLLRQLVGRLDDSDTMAFTDPLAALEALAEVDVDLILVDYVMPGIDGIEFIRRARQIPRQAMVPIVMVTTIVERTVRLEALQAGATDFLSKPIEPLEFKVRVRNLLALSRAQKAMSARAEQLDLEVAAKTRELADREREVIWRLSRATERRDTDTGDHIARMSRICGILARGVGLPEGDAQLVEIAAQMHDVGKVGIPDEILFKPGPLSAEERRVMETHAELGWNILEGSNSRLLQLAANIALSHHEKWDGTGYPQGLAGEAIPLEGRITALADVFDALRSVRPYKNAWPLDKARDFVVEGAGKHFDPALVDVFLTLFDEIAAIAGGHEEVVAEASAA